MVLKEINISDIDISNPKFIVPYKQISPELVNSIKDIGIINPPIVIKNDKEYLILTGFKRISISEELGLNTVFCRVVSKNEISFDQCIKIIYEDNKDRYTDIEIGELCRKHIDNGNDVKQFLKLIDYPTTEKNIQRFTYLSNIDSRIRNYYLDEKLNPEQCFFLSQIDTEDALLLLNKVIVPFRFNTNETREFLSELKDIYIRDDKPISQIVESVINTQEDITKNSIRLKIKKLRSPRLVEVEKEYNEIVKSLKLPKGVLISYSPYFENNYIEVKTRIDSENKLNELKILFENEDNFKRLLDLIRLVRGE
jgi:hypothetical protein